jgi:hypothetical protein
MRGEEHVSRMVGEEVHRGFWWGILREGNHLEDPGVDGRVILRRIFEKWNGGVD